MAAIDIIKRRLKEDRVPDVPGEIGEKKKRPREVAFMDVNLCFPCSKCPEFCPVECIEYLAPNTLPGRGVQPVQDRFQECIGCYICVEICSLLTDYGAIRMYDVDLVEQLLGVTITDRKPDVYTPAQPYEEYFSEGGAHSVRHLGKGSRIREKMNTEDARSRSEKENEPNRFPLPAVRHTGFAATGDAIRERSSRPTPNCPPPCLSQEVLRWSCQHQGWCGWGSILRYSYRRFG